MGLLANYLPNMLPEDPNQNQAARQGLLQFGAALLGGKGNFGSILGQGLAAGSGGYNSTLQALQQKALMDAQTKHMGLINQEAEQKIAEPGLIASTLRGASPSVSSAPSDLIAGQAAPLSSLPQMSPAADVPLSMIPQASVPGQIVAPPRAAPAVASQADDYAIYKARGDALANAGLMTAAKVQYDLAEKAKPKVKDVMTLVQNGKRVKVQTFDDGRKPQVLEGFDPDMEKLVGYGAGGTYNFADPFSGKTVSTAPITQSADSRASVAEQRRGHDLAHQDATAGDQAPLTTDAILNAAARYNVDGTLPPMGMGKNAAAGRSAILNKAAEMKYGVDPEQQRRDQLANRGEVVSQSAALKAFTSGKLGSSVRSFNVSISHLDTMQQLADALGNNDTQAINRVGNFFAKQTGQTAPTNFDAAKHIVADEVVKAIVGSGGALADREEAAKTIAAANSPAQLKGVISTYKELMKGQLDGLQQQYETSTGRKDFDRLLSGSAKETRTRHDVKPTSALPQKAIVAQPYADPGKEARYQEWKRRNGQ